MGDGLYDRIARGYGRTRRPDPTIARAIDETLGDAQSVVNIGAGAGSYEPTNRRVLAVEPAAEMRAQRPASSAPCLAANVPAKRPRHRDDRYRREGPAPDQAR